MEAGSFDIRSYLDKLYEEAEKAANAEKKPDSEGLIIPDTNSKAYKWLQGEYNKAKTEVKVEMKNSGGKFNPGYEMQTNLKSVKDFKPGMFGNSSKQNKPEGLKGTEFKNTKKEDIDDNETVSQKTDKQPEQKGANNAAPSTAKKPSVQVVTQKANGQTTQKSNIVNKTVEQNKK